MTLTKKTLFAALVFGACWGGAVWYWRATNREPSSADLAIYLVALPLGLLLACWLGARLLALTMAAPAVSVAAPAPDVQPPAPEPGASAAPLAILAAAVRGPHGATPEDLAAALAENKARADLDPELMDNDGFPVMTARSTDADDASVQQEVATWFEQNGLRDLHLDSERLRALAMGGAVAGELAAAACASVLPLDAATPTLQLLPLLPHDWSVDERSAGTLWLHHVVATAGWPAPHIALAPVLPDAHGDDPLAALGRLSQHAAANGGAVLSIVIACDSHIGPASIAQWAARNALFTPSRPQGLIPGEGAAGLLLLDQQRALALTDTVVSMLHTVEEARRHNSADDAKKIDADTLGTLTALVLARGAAQAADVALLVADTGHRTSRVLELMNLAGAATPQLDPDADVVSVGAACGTCGAVPFMTALALARYHATERDAPVLSISNEDPYRRCAALIRPAASLS